MLKLKDGSTLCFGHVDFNQYYKHSGILYDLEKDYLGLKIALSQLAFSLLMIKYLLGYTGIYSRVRKDNNFYYFSSLNNKVQLVCRREQFSGSVTMQEAAMELNTLFVEDICKNAIRRCDKMFRFITRNFK